MVAEISPVNAPSLLQETFWPEMAMLVLCAASAAAEIAVKGGAMTMSQWLEFATSGAKAEKNPRVSARVLYIFQVPAITRRRMHPSSQDKKKEKDNAETQRTPRIRGEELLSFYLLVRASTPGSLRPPRNSREAPPPVEM